MPDSRYGKSPVTSLRPLAGKMNALVATTQHGQFSFELHVDRAPKTCAYFLNLARAHALADSRIFRILSDTNRQLDDSCPINVLQLGPAERFGAPRQTIPHESTSLTGLSHKKWTVSAARFDPGELYSSFFICMRDEPELDEGGNRQPDGLGFAAFGRVIDGFEVLESIYQLAESHEMLANPIPVVDISLHESKQK